MKTTNIIKKLLGKNEVIKYKFSLSKLYIKLKMAIALVMTFLVLGVITLVLIYFNNFQDFSQRSFQQTFSPNSTIDFEDQNFEESSLFGQEDGQEDFSVIFVMLTIFIFIILPIILFYYLYYLKISHEYVFTNQRILIKRGWLSTKATSVRYNRITDVSITQSFINRLLKIGTLAISTAGSEGYEVSLSHINNPHEVKKTLYDFKSDYEDYQQDLINNNHAPRSSEY